MTPATVVRAADAAQFLTFVPRMLGYIPTESLVLIPFHHGRSLGAMRFDLPPGEAADSTAATVLGMACRLPDADAVAAIVYTDRRFDDDDRMPHRALLDALERRAHACGLRLTDLLCVAGDAWGSTLDPACPPAGRSLDDLNATSAGLTGLPAPDGDQSSGAALPECTTEERERVAKALDALDRAVALLCGPEAVGATAHRTTAAADAASTLTASADAGADSELAAATYACDLGPVPAPVSDDFDTGCPVESGGRVDPRALSTACRFDDLPGLYEEALSAPPATCDAYEWAALIWCLARPSLRDVALVQWSGDAAQGDEALDAQLRWEAGADYPSHLAMRMWGEGDRPDAGRLESALEITRHAAAMAPERSQPGALAMCAWLSWALGRSTHAASYAQRALDIEPEHGLSEIVLSFVGAGHLPDWAFRASPPA